ncbi:MAG TPA: MFS transporter, partial [Rudaea sp.]|nr:MFS transporter [Rudaea sp.]
AFWFYSPQSIGLVVGSYILHGFFYGITIPLLWAMIADVADYSEWKNHRRATAIVFSAMLCGLKFGLSLGGTLVAAILAAYGYDATLPTQGPEVVHGIQLAVSVYCSIPFLLGVALLFGYELDKSMESRIERDLGARRVGAATPA